MFCCFSSRRPTVTAPDSPEHAGCQIDRPLGDGWKYDIIVHEGKLHYQHTIKVKDREGNPYQYRIDFDSRVKMETVLYIKAIKHTFSLMSASNAQYYLRLTYLPILVPIMNPREDVNTRSVETPLLGNQDNVGPVAYGILFYPNQAEPCFHFFRTDGAKIQFIRCTERRAKDAMVTCAFHQRMFPWQDDQPNQHYHVNEPHKRRFKQEHGIDSNETREQRAREILRQLQIKEVENFVSLYERLKDKTSLKYFKLMNAIGVLYTEMGDYSEGINYYFRAKTGFERLEEDDPNKYRSLSTVYHNISQCYRMQGNVGEAEAYQLMYRGALRETKY